MELRGVHVTACISPVMTTNAEHTIIRIPEDTRNLMGVSPGQRIRIKNRFFTVKQVTREELNLIAMEPVVGQNECVMFSTQHWRDEDFTDLHVRAGRVNPGVADTPINVEVAETDQEPIPAVPTLRERFPNSTVTIQGQNVVVCEVTGPELTKGSIGIPKVLRDRFGVVKGNSITIDTINKNFTVDPSFKADLEAYKPELKESELIFVNPDWVAEGVEVFSKRIATTPAAPVVPQVDIKDIIKKIEDVVGPKSIVINVDEIEDKNKEKIFTFDLTWSGDYVNGRATGYSSIEAAKSALADLQKNLITMVEDANTIVESLNELNENIQ